MEVASKKIQLPLDFSLNVKTEKPANISISVNSDDGSTVILSPEKMSTSAFKVVTPKNADGKKNIYMKQKLTNCKNY